MTSWTVRWWLGAVAWWLLTTTGARAEEAAVPGRDLAGFAWPATSGRPGDAVLLPTPPGGTRRWSVSLAGEWAAETARWFEFSAEGDEPVPAGTLERLARLHLGGRVELGRLGIGATLPVVLGTVAGDLDADGEVDSAGTTLGDLTVWVPVALLPPSDEGVQLAAIPYVTLPTGSQDQFVGDPGPAAGVLAAGALALASVRLDGHVGAQLSAVQEVDLQQYGGLEVPFGLGVSGRLASTVWLGAELRGISDLGAATIEEPRGDELRSVAATPIEVFATLRTTFGSSEARGPFAFAAGGVAALPALGAARGGRGLVGVGWQGGGKAATFAPFVVRASAPDGIPLADAAIRLGSREVGRTDAEGEATIELREPPRQLLLDAPGFPPTVFDVGDRASPDRAIEVVPPWPAREVPLRVTDEDGTPVAPRWTAASVDDPLREAIEGEGPVALGPGIWDVRFTADGLAGQGRRVRVTPRGPAAPEVDVVLLPPRGPATVALQVRNVEGEGIRGAQVLVDGRVVGTTAHDGRITVEAVEEGARRVEIQHPDYTTTTLDVATGDEITPVVVSRQRGSVRVTVRDGRGEPVRDAVARFLGPRRLPPLPLGDTGQRGLVLGPGSWTLLVSSATFGVQERTIEVPEDGWELVDVVVVLQRDEAGQADLVIRVVDPEGRPVPGAALRLDERDLGATSSGGSLALFGLTAGTRVLEVGRDGLRPVDPVTLDLVAGPQETVVRVRWEPGLLDVVARSPEGPVSDGVLRFLGPQAQSPSALDPSGRQRFTLAPGPWTVLLTSGTYGAQQRSVTIPPDADVRHVVEFLLQPTEGGEAELAVTVQDPLGRPVDGARVSLDAQPVGTTSNAGDLRVEGLVARERTLDIEAPLLEPLRETLTLTPGVVERAYELDWGPGVVRARVTRDGTPVDDAIVRFLGPESRPPRPVDGAGRTLAQLTPGRWTVLAISETAGVGEASLIVPETPGLTEVTVAVTPAAAGRTDLVVRVTDPLGAPVTGAVVQIEEARPVPAPGSVLVARGLPRRTITLEVTAPGFVASPTLEVALDRDRVEQLVQLPFVEVPVEIRAADARGRPLEGARVRVEGPRADADLVTNPQGVARVALPHGRYGVVAALGERSGADTLLLDRETDIAELALVLTEGGARRDERSVVIEERVRFDFNQATLKPQSRPILEAVARILRSDPTILKVEVQGHTDNLGTAEVNQRLSDVRAQVVVAELVSLGVAPEKLVSRGYGRRRPQADNETREGRALNRRVQFAIVEQASRPPETP